LLGAEPAPAHIVLQKDMLYGGVLRLSTQEYPLLFNGYTRIQVSLQSEWFLLNVGSASLSSIASFLCMNVHLYKRQTSARRDDFSQQEELFVFQ
jgi:hypothetical protein